MFPAARTTYYDDGCDDNDYHDDGDDDAHDDGDDDVDDDEEDHDNGDMPANLSQ